MAVGLMLAPMMPERGPFAWRLVWLFGLAGLLVAPKARAWGDDGHRVVGEIAWHYLSPAAQRVVSASLDQPDYATAITSLRKEGALGLERTSGT